MSKKNNTKDECDSIDDDMDVFDDIEIHFDDDIIGNKKSEMDYFDARRRLERVLEDKALQRLINGDFY